MRRLQVNRRSDVTATIYELIESQIKETVSSGSIKAASDVLKLFRMQFSFPINDILKQL